MPPGLGWAWLSQNSFRFQPPGVFSSSGTPSEAARRTPNELFAVELDDGRICFAGPWGGDDA